VPKGHGKLRVNRHGNNSNTSEDISDVTCALLPVLQGSGRKSNLATAASMGPTAQYRVDNDGVAVITLTNPPVNALHPAGA
jgi:hypothetical protein